jgi:23S rRNA (cytidine2498-2'-O)-methyltransferase
MGAEVLCVDRTAPDERLLRSPRVSFLKRDAFALVPEETGPWDWVFSDVACYPSRLLGWIRRWLESGMARRMVCTIKLQGKIDWELLAEFDAIPGGEVRRLNYNKHELTWLYSTEEP